MLIEHTFFGIEDKVKIAVERLRKYEELTEGEGYYLAFSGGKDSCVIKALANMAGVKYDAHYSVTGIDPPEVVKFIRKQHPDVKFEKNCKSILRMIPTKGFPIRHGRWCCEYLKEHGGDGRVVVTGLRKAESIKRRARQLLEGNTLKQIVNPVIDWTDHDVWQFIGENNIPYCKLYNEGWRRIGCLFCPCARKQNRLKEMELYPKMAEAFIRAFERLYQNRKEAGITSVDRWKDGKEMFYWWINR